jgi:hypothetical protein
VSRSVRSTAPTDGGSSVLSAKQSHADERSGDQRADRWRAACAPAAPRRRIVGSRADVTRRVVVRGARDPAPATDLNSYRSETAPAAWLGGSTWLAQVLERLACGALEYGDASLSRPPMELLEEIAEEAADLGAWAAIT